MHERVNILQYVKTPIGRWQWEPIPENRRTGNWICSNGESDQIYIVWREEERSCCQNAGGTASETLAAMRKMEIELAGGDVLQAGKPIPQPKNCDFSCEPAAYLSLKCVNSPVPSADPVRA